MEEIYKKSIISDLSEYEIEVNRTQAGRYKISIEHFFSDRNSSGSASAVVFSPKLLDEFISALSDCREVIGLTNGQKEVLTLAQKKEIQRRHHKGVSVKDLCMQFDKTEVEIENALREGGIPILDPRDTKPPRPYYPKYRKRH